MGAMQIKRNILSSIPTLAVGEMYLATDSGSETLYIGTASGNKIIAVSPAAYTAQSVMAAVTDGNPQPVTIAANSFLGRAGGNVADIAVSASQIVGRDANSVLKGLSTSEVDALLAYIKKSIGTTKGDIIAFSGSGTPIRVGVGTDAKVLTAKAAAADGSGMEWAAVSGGVSSPITKNIAGNLYVAHSATAFYHLITFPAAATIASIECGCVTAPTGSNLIMDFLYHATAPASATTIYTTGPLTNAPTIADGAYYTSTSGVPDVTSMDANSFLLVCIHQVGSTIAGADLSYTITFS